MRSTILAVVTLTGIALIPSPAIAQDKKPLPFVVFDLRGARTSLGNDDTTASDLNVLGEQLPGKGFALSGGVHTYPFRRHGFAIGLGVEGILTRASAKDVLDKSGVVIPEVSRSLSGVAGILSLNFGGRDGWSYLSGGVGPLRFETISSEIPHGEAPTNLTQNFGGGARWFVKPHMAVGFDVRLYLTRPEVTTTESAGRDRMNVVVIAVGITLR